MAKKVIKFQDSLGEYLKGCESTKVTLKAIMIDINLEHFELEGNSDIIIHIINDVEGLNMLDEYEL
jgi:hypothetical protein